MPTNKTLKIIAQRMAVVVLNNNAPILDAEEDGITEKEIQTIMSEYNKIVNRLYNVAVKNGGEFNRYSF